MKKIIDIIKTDNNLNTIIFEDVKTKEITKEVIVGEIDITVGDVIYES